MIGEIDKNYVIDADSFAFGVRSQLAVIEIAASPHCFLPVHNWDILSIHPSIIQIYMVMQQMQGSTVNRTEHIFIDVKLRPLTVAQWWSES